MEVTQAKTVDDVMPTDAKLGQDMEQLVREAAERATFHRVEVERWERIGRAAGRALRAVQSCDPVAQVTPEDFYSEDSPALAPDYATFIGSRI